MRTSIQLTGQNQGVWQCWDSHRLQLERWVCWKCMPKTSHHCTRFLWRSSVIIEARKPEMARSLSFLLTKRNSNIFHTSVAHQISVAFHFFICNFNCPQFDYFSISSCLSICTFPPHRLSKKEKNPTTKKIANGYVPVSE